MFLHGFLWLDDLIGCTNVDFLLCLVHHDSVRSSPNPHFDSMISLQWSSLLNQWLQGAQILCLHNTLKSSPLHMCQRVSTRCLCWYPACFSPNMLLHEEKNGLLVLSLQRALNINSSGMTPTECCNETMIPTEKKEKKRAESRCCNGSSQSLDLNETLYMTCRELWRI